MIRGVAVLLLIFCVFSLFGAGTPDGGSERLKAFVTIPPQAEFVERIAGDLVDVEVLISGEQDPHTFQLSPSQVVALGKADLYFAVGLSFEASFLEKLQRTLPNLRIVTNVEEMALIPLHGHEMEDEHGHEMEDEDGHEMEDEDGHEDEDEHGHEDEDEHGHEDEDEHGHEDEDEHGHEVEDEHGHEHEDEHAHEMEDEHGHMHGDTDPHFWLDPAQMVLYSESVMKRLVDVLPGSREVLQNNYLELKADIERLDSELHTMLHPVSGRDMLVYHPSYAYFANAYNLTQIALEVDGRAPSPKQLADLLAHCREQNITTIFVQPESPMISAKKFADTLDGEVVVLEVLSRDWFGLMRNMGKKVLAGIKQ